MSEENVTKVRHVYELINRVASEAAMTDQAAIDLVAEIRGRFAMRKPRRSGVFRRGPGRTRTCALRIMSPLLYQLSYRPGGALWRARRSR
jgi:hypothetical protein